MARPIEATPALRDKEAVEFVKKMEARQRAVEGASKVYIVGDYGPEHYSIKSIHKTYEGALKAWNEHRMSLLNSAKYMMESSPEYREMYADIIKVLSCKDPEKIKDAGFCDEKPFLEEKKVVD